MDDAKEGLPLELSSCFCESLFAKLGIKVISEGVVIVIKVVAESTEHGLFLD